MSPAVAQLHAEARADYARNQSPATQLRIHEDLTQAHGNAVAAEDLQRAVAYRPQSGGAS